MPNIYDLTVIQVIIGIISLFIIGGATTFLIKKSNKKQIQKSGNNSFSIQSGRDTKIK